MSSLPLRVPPKPAQPAGNIIVAGQHCGKRVLCTPGTYKYYKELEAQSHKGNHWARIIIRGISALTSGNANLDNVFVKKGFGPIYAKKRGAFYVSLPGILVTFEDLDGESYILTHIKVEDTSYFEHQRQALKPGLWSVKKDKELQEWNASFVPSGHLRPVHKHRHVAIADRGYKSLDEAARKVAEGLREFPGITSDIIEKDGFDMHYTPGGKKIAGFLNLREAYFSSTAPSLRESAQLLANTMYRAKDMESVYWYSDWGGSGVLAQAMRRLSVQGVTLKKHAFIMDHPTTPPRIAEALGRELGLTTIKGGQRTHNPAELLGRMVFVDGLLSGYRKWQDDESYTGKHLLKDAGKSAYEAMDTLSGGIGAAGTVGALIGTGVIGSFAVSPIVTASGIAGVGFFVVNNIIKKVYKSIRR